VGTAWWELAQADLLERQVAGIHDRVKLVVVVCSGVSLGMTHGMHTMRTLCETCDATNGTRRAPYIACITLANMPRGHWWWPAELWCAANDSTKKGPPVCVDVQPAVRADGYEGTSRCTRFRAGGVVWHVPCAGFHLLWRMRGRSAAIGSAGVPRAATGPVRVERRFGMMSSAPSHICPGSEVRLPHICPGTVSKDPVRMRAAKRTAMAGRCCR
jgi:hypothetical protein